MPVLIRIAWRNLIEHKAKTAIIGIIIALGIVILIVGNSMMDTASLGIRKTFIDNYTGHIMVSGKADTPVSLFGAQSMGMGDTKTPTIPQYETVREYITSRPDVLNTTSQVTGFAGMSVHQEGNLGDDERNFTMLFGIEPESYRSMFNGITIVEGDYLKPGEEGILVSKKRVERFEKNDKIVLKPGDDVILTGFGDAGFKIRKVPVRGIYVQNQENEALDQISFIDVQSLRALMGMVVGSKEEIAVAKEEASLLSTDNLDDLFSEDVTVEQTSSDTKQMSEEELANLLGDTSARERASRIDSGAWHYLLIKLKNPNAVPKVLAELNMWFAAQKIPAQAVDWKAAAGPFGATADVLRTVFNVAILIVAVVAVIIIMNTLVISVIERTPEIGTMRALGARKSFVWKMFLLETLTISVVFGVIGIIVGGIIIGILNVTGIKATNAFLSVLFGGAELKPVLSPLAVINGLVTVVFIGFLSHLYPVRIALKIPPIKAIQND